MWPLFNDTPISGRFPHPRFPCTHFVRTQLTPPSFSSCTGILLRCCFPRLFAPFLSLELLLGCFLTHFLPTDSPIIAPQSPPECHCGFCAEHPQLHGCSTRPVCGRPTPHCRAPDWHADCTPPRRLNLPQPSAFFFGRLRSAIQIRDEIWVFECLSMESLSEMLFFPPHFACRITLAPFSSSPPPELTQIPGNFIG